MGAVYVHFSLEGHHHWWALFGPWANTRSDRLTGHLDIDFASHAAVPASRMDDELAEGLEGIWILDMSDLSFPDL